MPSTRTRAGRPRSRPPRSTGDRALVPSVLQAHEHFGALFVGVDLQRLNVSQVDHWITRGPEYNELVRLPDADASVRFRGQSS